MYTNALQFLLHRSRKFLGIYNTGDQPFKAFITANHRRSTLKRPLDSPSQGTLPGRKAHFVSLESIEINHTLCRLVISYRSQGYVA